MEVICHFCKKIFKKFPSEMKKNRSGIHYCSKSCQYHNTSICTLCGKEKQYKDKRISKTLCKKCFYHSVRLKYPETVKRQNERNRLARLKKKGLPLDTPKRTRKFESYISSHGYRILYKDGHPNCYKGSEVFEHTYVMSEYLGRPIRKGETIHHKNGDRLDNKIENLELWNRSHPPGQRVQDRLEFYKEFLKQYGYKVLDPIVKE